MSTVSRPSPQPSYQPIDYVAELVAIVALVSQGGCALFIYPTLPQTIPIHFGFDGRANNFGEREWNFFPFAVALALYILLTVISRFPQAFNYPWRVTEANAPRLYVVARRMVVWLKAETELLFAYMTWAIVRYTTVTPGPFDFGFVVIALPSDLRHDRYIHLPNAPRYVEPAIASRNTSLTISSIPRA